MKLQLENRLVALIQRSAEIDGSAISGLTVAEAVLAGGGRVHVVFGADGPIIDQYKALGCQTSISPHGQWLQKSAGMLRAARRLYRDWIASTRILTILKKIEPDLIYVNSLVGWAGALASRKLKTPLVWHLRELFADVGGEAYPPSIGGKFFVRREVKRLSDRVVVVSTAVAEQVLASEITGTISLIPNCLPDSFTACDSLERPQVRQDLGIEQSDFVVGAVGSIRHVKGFDVLVKALALLIGRPSLQLVIAGAGPRAELAELATQLGVLDKLRLLGPLQPIRPFYNACDIVCIPSRSESFGRVAVEAMSCGLPIIATNVGGMRDTIVHQETGLHIEPDSPEQLGHAIMRLHGDAALRKSLATAGRRRFQELFTQTPIRRKLVETMSEALNQA